MVQVRDAAELSEQRGGAVLRDVSDPVLTRRVYDHVDGTWLEAKAEMADQQYLEKLVWKCSCCTFTTSDVSVAKVDDRTAGRLQGSDAVEEHVQQVQMRYESHRTAEVIYRTEQSETWQVCSACGYAVRARKNAVPLHIERIKTGWPAHRGAEAQLIRRFTRSQSDAYVLQSVQIDVSGVAPEPALPEPVSLAAVRAREDGVGAVSRQHERSRRHRKRGRGRRHKEKQA